MTVTKAGRIQGGGSPGIYLASAAKGLASFCATASDKSLDAAGQTHEILTRAEEYLAELGADKNHLVMTQVWLLDMEELEGFTTAWQQWLGDTEPPALSIVGASAASHDSLVEIRVYASTPKETLPA